MNAVHEAQTIALDERLAWQAYVSAVLARQSDAPAPEGGRLSALAECFGLNVLERDVVAMLWTASLAPQLRAELVQHDPWALQLTLLVACRTFGHPERLRLPSESPLRLWLLVSEHDTGDGNAVLQLDPHIQAWLDGAPELDRALIGCVQIIDSSVALPDWPVAETASRIAQQLPAGERWLVEVLGDDSQAGLDFAAAVAGQLGLPALCVLPQGHAPDKELAIRIQRQAFLDRVAPVFAAAEGAHLLKLVLQHGLSVFPLQFSLGTTAPVPSALQRLPVSLPAPDAAARHQLWLHHLPQAAAWPAAPLGELATRYALSQQQIRQVAAMQPAAAAEAARHARVLTRDDLGGLAQHIDGELGWDDLVLPETVRERLGELAFEAAERNRFWADAATQRLYPYGRGLTALFAGPPGTGKTMAAQVIACELGLDLLRIDVSAVLSKWVGETAQHFQRILSSPACRHAVLFFDEADALYGKRVEETRDAQDRYANMDISHLMVALESFDGIVLMATNLKANIDPAFLRRIRHVIEFPRPDASARIAIWQRVLSTLFGDGLLATQALERLAGVAATGAQIKGAALSAAFAARRARQQPDLPLLAATLARELAKDGDGLSARELASFEGAA
ncbi:ATPase family associated with various cellular activities (AAA) [Andreprevotia lacus DSM 23236]|jgi:adenylate kinase family enzyme|uniref:ATPase family associated with various cellular activities (AAA) n=1 Tax=Andreprevotia lacus DSM 23236 TaxID=1121001 RepID=A0A1W1X6Y4_9NEIS|nr:ATP-binding protein [Andreprevotia lacus]SMC19729.1 ATPase family associated with various cellular activities (AAA) [Andreprevotia lacus DSM 23236]